MRSVAIVTLSVAILAFVTQSVSASPASSSNQVDQVNQEANLLTKRQGDIGKGIDGIGAFGVNDTNDTNDTNVNNVNNVNIAFEACLKDGLHPDECAAILGL